MPIARNSVNTEFLDPNAMEVLIIQIEEREKGEEREIIA